MKHIIEKQDGLYCVYRQERAGQRIIGAYATRREAKDAIERQKGGVRNENDHNHKG